MSDMAKMGRPALGNQATNIRMSDDARERIRALVGERGMSQFIREAIDNELSRRERAAAKQKPKRSNP